MVGLFRTHQCQRSTLLPKTPRIIPKPPRRRQTGGAEEYPHLWETPPNLRDHLRVLGETPMVGKLAPLPLRLMLRTSQPTGLAAYVFSRVASHLRFAQE